MKYGMNTPCMTCRQKNDTYLYHQLHSLYLDLAHSIEPINDHYEKFYWNNNVKCKYGIYCNDLNMYNNKLNRICEDLEPYLVAIAKSKDKNRIQLLQRCLQILRGNYPNIYRQLDQMYNKYHL